MYSRLPARPSLAHLRNQAKKLLTALRVDDANAFERARASFPKHAGASDDDLRAAGLALADAQHVVAREYGFTSWPRMKQYVEGLEAYPGDRGLSGGRYTVEAHEERAREILRQHGVEDPTAARRLRAYAPRFLDATDGEIAAAEVTVEDAQQVVAREHAFPSWAGLVESLGSRQAVEQHVVALCARIGAGDQGATDDLLTLLRENTHHWRMVVGDGLGQLGFGSDRRAVAQNCAAALTGSPASPGVDGELLARFIDEGLTDALMIVSIWTPHPDDDVVHTLLDASATIGDVTIGHQTALEAAIMDRGAEASGVIERLAARRVHRSCLWVAAGSGRLDLVKAYFAPDGTLTPDAGSHRMNMANLGYLPHLPKTDDRQEIVNEALFAACRTDRVDVAEHLVAQGADVNAEHDTFGDTPLTWAEHVGAGGVARFLASHGGSR